jgi:hypothetical protein
LFSNDSTLQEALSFDAETKGNRKQAQRIPAVQVVQVDVIVRQMVNVVISLYFACANLEWI